MTPPDRRHTARLALAGAFAGLFAVAVGIAAGGGDGIEQARLAARYTARASFLLFLPVFLASTLHRAVARSWSLWLVAERRGMGLCFAAAHFVHLAALSRFFAISDQPPPVVTLIGGGLGYIGIMLLVLTSTDGAMRALGRRWMTLHRNVIWYVWAIFLFSYGRRALTLPEFIIPAMLLILAGAARIALARPIPRS